jgi:hypothetical protein
MSFTEVRSYFRARCKAVGLTEHTDAFNNNNIPSTVIDKSFHLGAPAGSSRKLNQNDHEFDIGMELVVYFKGYRNPSEGLDRSIEVIETLVKEIEKPSNRLGVCLKNVVVQSVNWEALADSNDNSIRARVSCNVITSLGL